MESKSSVSSLSLKAESKLESFVISQSQVLSKVMIPDDGDDTAVFFDLETTGLDVPTCDIIQLSAISGENSFNVYFLPRCSITDEAAELTGLTVHVGTLYLRGEPMQTSLHRQALTRFISFLKTFNRPFLVGHNSRKFDCPVLLRVLKEFALSEEFREVVSGCVDTWRLSKDMFRLKKYSQQFLVQHFLGKTYRAHDATEDAQTLQELYRVWSPCKELVMRHKVIM